MDGRGHCNPDGVQNVFLALGVGTRDLSGINYDPVGWVIGKHLLWQDGRPERPCVSGLILIFGIHIALSTWQNLIDQTANEGRTSENRPKRTRGRKGLATTDTVNVMVLHGGGDGWIKRGKMQSHNDNFDAVPYKLLPALRSFPCPFRGPAGPKPACWVPPGSAH